MENTKHYDGELQMFRETAGSVNLAHLRFLRWLIENGRLEHRPAGPPSGPLAESPVGEAPLEEAA
jgi:hypothetical protein